MPDGGPNIHRNQSLKRTMWRFELVRLRGKTGTRVQRLWMMRKTKMKQTLAVTIP